MYVFVQPVMKRISAGPDRTEAPAGPGSFMMLNYTWSDSHSLTERTPGNLGAETMKPEFGRLRRLIFDSICLPIVCQLAEIGFSRA